MLILQEQFRPSNKTFEAVNIPKLKKAGTLYDIMGYFYAYASCLPKNSENSGKSRVKEKSIMKNAK